MRPFLLLLMLLLLCPTAWADAPQDQLSQCLSDSTSGKDRKDFARWMVVAMAQHPAVSDLANVTPEKIDTVNKTVADLYTRLMLTDCLKEIKAVSKLGGDEAVGKSFEFFGRLAMQELMTEPKVTQTMSAVAKYLDHGKFRAAFSTP